MNGDFAAQRRFGIEQCGCKWVLFIDSDELVSDESLRRSSMFCKAERRQRIFSSVKTIFHITTLLTDR